MATANAQTVVKVTGIKLELSELEARTIRDLMQVIGGSPHDTRRGVTDDINEALREAGVQRSGHSQQHQPTRARDVTGSIIFV